MKIILLDFPTFLKLLLLSIFLTGCNMDSNTTQPQIADKDSVGCLITNDFYAVHFTAYLKPSQNKNGSTNTDRDALLRPYCQELPNPGIAFFAADLIDRDIRKTPIGIRLVELKLSGKNDTKVEDFQEIQTISEVAPKLYPTGVVEAQAEIKNYGYYALFLLIGDEEALSEDDKLRIPFHVGADPNKLTTKLVIQLSVGLVVAFITTILFICLYRKKLKTKKSAINIPTK